MWILNSASQYIHVNLLTQEDILCLSYGFVLPWNNLEGSTLLGHEHCSLRVNGFTYTARQALLQTADTFSTSPLSLLGLISPTLFQEILHWVSLRKPWGNFSNCRSLDSLQVSALEIWDDG